MEELQTTMKTSTFVLAALLSATMGTASAAVIDFDSAPVSSGLPLKNAMAYSEDGFLLQSSLGNTLYHNDIFQPMVGMNTNGTAVLGWCGSYCGGAKTITLTGYGLLSLASIDVASLVAGSGSGKLLVNGYLDTGGTVSQVVNYGDRWITASFAGFSNLTRIEIYSGDTVDVAVDNLVVSALPEPASLSLLGIALAGAMVRRRGLSARRNNV